MSKHSFPNEGKILEGKRRNGEDETTNADKITQALFITNGILHIIS